MENLIFRHGRIFPAKCDLYHSSLIDDLHSEKLMLPRRCAPVEFFSWKCGKLRKPAKSGYPALIWLFRTSLFSALSWNKISQMKLQSPKMFKTTKDMFYKHFDFFFCELTGPIMGLREPCPLVSNSLPMSHTVTSISNRHLKRLFITCSRISGYGIKIISEKI